MKNILVSMPTYSEKDVIPPYLMNNLNGWLMQDIDADIDIVLTDSVSNHGFDRKIRKFCVENSTENRRFHYITNKIHETTYVSVNIGYRFMKDKQYDYYAYCSDDTVMTKRHDLNTILSTFDEEPRAAIVQAKVNLDNAASWYPHYSARDDDKNLKVKLGEAVNLHFAFFSRYFMEKYNFKYPDILLSYATETLLTFFVKAIEKEWYLCRKTTLRNDRGLKRFSKVNRRPGHKRKTLGFTGYGVYKNFKTFDEIFKEGTKVGMGFECWRGTQSKKVKKRSPNPYWYMPDMSCYDEEEKCKQPELLYRYIIENMYLPENIINYDHELNRIIG